MIKRIVLLPALSILLLALVAGCAAPQVTQQPAPSPTPAATQPPQQKSPAATSAPPESIGINPEDITLNDQGLVDSWQAVLVPATPFDNMHAPGPSGLPTHIQVLFNGVSDPKSREPGGPVIYIIPVDAYRELWDSHDSQAVSSQIQKIEALRSQLPDPKPVRGLPVLPIEETFGINDFATQLRPIAGDAASAGHNGFRFIGRFAMDATPLTNAGLRYIYQGFSNDRRYLVTFFFPVRTDALPDDLEAVSTEDMDAFNSDGLGYLADKAAMLDALPATAWEPDLTRLDALIASLAIK